MTGIRQPPVPYTLAHLGKPYDLVNVPEECPNLTNTCQVITICCPLILMKKISNKKMYCRENHVAQADCVYLMEGEVTLANKF